MKPSTAHVLALLREGPQTTQTLGLACGFRFGARIEELRNEHHCEIETTRLPAPANGSRYTLLSEPESFGDSDTPPASSETVCGAEDTPGGLFDGDEYSTDGPAGAYDLGEAA